MECLYLQAFSEAVERLGVLALISEDFGLLEDAFGSIREADLCRRSFIAASPSMPVGGGKRTLVTVRKQFHLDMRKGWEPVAHGRG